jgi:hypothetical protein
MKLLTRLAVLVAASAALVIPTSGPAAAAQNCWSEASLDKYGQTVVGTHYRYCAHSDVVQPMGVGLQIKVCNELACSWSSLVSGVGTVSVVCEFWMGTIRHARFPSLKVTCPPF